MCQKHHFRTCLRLLDTRRHWLCVNLSPRTCICLLFLSTRRYWLCVNLSPRTCICLLFLSTRRYYLYDRNPFLYLSTPLEVFPVCQSLPTYLYLSIVPVYTEVLPACELECLYVKYSNFHIFIHKCANNML